MGIEPTYSAWKADVLPLNHTCISVSLKGFEPLTLGLEGRCSIQLSYRLIYYVFRKHIGVTGFEPATPWSQTRYSSQTEPHPVNLFFLLCLSQTHTALYMSEIIMSSTFFGFTEKIHSLNKLYITPQKSFILKPF